MTHPPVHADHGPPASARSFIAALGVGVAIAGCLRWWLVHTRDAGFEADGAALRDTLSGTLLLQIAVTVAFGLAAVATMPALRADRLPSRRLQQLLGALASMTLAISLGAVMLSIYRRKEAGYELLAESFALYLAINLVFLFWYWYADHPLRTGVHLEDRTVDFDQGIRFPEEGLAADADRPGSWVPGLTDYLYFTLLSSNCFGAPEGHVLIGRTLKLVQIVHTVFMIFVFIIIVSRAINTLA